MKIAIIEDDNSLTEKLGTALRNTDWSIDFFKGSSDFGRSTLDQYDVVISDLSLEPLSGRNLLQSISEKTSAELYLMNDGPFTKGDLESEHIRGLINKNDTEDFINKLRYVNVKLRIQKLAEEGKEDLQKIVNNGDYSIEIKDDILIVCLKNYVGTVEKVKTIISSIPKSVAVRYTINDLNSSHLGLIAVLYNTIIKQKRKIAYWNESNSEKIPEIFRACRLDTIVPVFSEYEKLLTYLKS